MNCLLVFNFRRRLSALAFISVLSLGSFVSPGSSNSLQASITVVETTAGYEFGQSMTFSLVAESPDSIAEATLFIETDGDTRTSVLEAEFTSGRRITAEIVRDLQREPLRPFSPLQYWWRVVDGVGGEVTTDRATLIYEDNRFEWEAAQRDSATVHWHTGDLAFGQAAADIAAMALPRIARDLGLEAPGAVDVYIYAAVAELQAGLELNGRAWVGGHADPDLGVVLVAAPPGAEALLALERDIPHELTHVLIYQATTPNYSAVPAWLNEGLAVQHETQPNPNYRVVLERAQAAGEMLPLDSLCGAFPVNSSEATLAYAQSASLAGYVRDRWGAAGVQRLLQAYADGASCEGGVQRALQITLAGLESGWARDVLRASPLRTLALGIGPWLLVFLIPGAALALFLFAPRRAVPTS